MRVPVRNPLSPARPDRGVLLATLFGLLTLGLVVAFGVVDGTDPLIDAGADSSDAESASGQPRKLSETTEQAAVAQATTRSVGPTSSVQEQAVKSNYQDPIAELEGKALSTSEVDSLVLSSPPPQPDPAPPATVDTTTGAPTTTVVVDSGGDTTNGDGGSETTVDSGTSSSTETTDPTAGSSTTEGPTTTVAGSWIDAGNGVLVPPVLVAIRFCESTDNYLAVNPYSTARGAYQFLTTSWASYGHADRYGVSQAHLATPAQQDEAALITWQRDGTTPWLASSSCWG